MGIAGRIGEGEGRGGWWANSILPGHGCYRRRERERRGEREREEERKKRREREEEREERGRQK